LLSAFPDDFTSTGVRALISAEVHSAIGSARNTKSRAAPTSWNSRSSVPPQVCGIYPFKIAGVGFDVDQTVDLTSRLASHRRRSADIIALSFIEYGPNERDHLGRTLINQAERSFPVLTRW